MLGIDKSDVLGAGLGEKIAQGTLLQRATRRFNIIRGPGFKASNKYEFSPS